MRVIAGSLGGPAPEGSGRERRRRPTSERVREALFAMLGDIEGRARARPVRRHGRARDRGALAGRRAGRVRRAATAVRSRCPAREPRRSLEIDPEVAQVRRADVLAALRSAEARKETYDLVFIDPPYRRRARAGEPSCRRCLPALLAPEARVVVESDRRAPLELQLPSSSGSGATATHPSQFTESMTPPITASPSAPAPTTRSPTGIST